MQQNQRVRIPYLGILMVYLMTYFIYTDFGMRTLFGVVLVALIVGACVVYEVRNGQLSFFVTKYDIALFWLAGVTGLLCCLPGANRNKEVLGYCAAMLLCCGICLLARPNRLEMENILSLAIGTQVVFSCFVIFFTLFPGVYRRLVFPLLDEIAQWYNSKNLRYGYGVSLGASLSYTSYLIFMGIAASIGRMYQGKKGRIPYTVYIVVGIFALLVLRRRTELLAAGIAILLTLGYLYRQNLQKWVVVPLQEKMKRLRALPHGLLLFCGGILAGLVVLILLVFVLKQIPFFARFFPDFSEGFSLTKLLTGRPLLWGMAISGFLQHPILGVGWGNFGSLISDSFYEKYSLKVHQAHNDLLQFLAETGLVGTLLLVPVILLLFVQTYRVLKKLCAEPDKRSLPIVSMVIFSFMVQLFFLIASLVDPIYTKGTFWPIFCIAVQPMAFAERWIRNQRRRARR